MTSREEAQRRLDVLGAAVLKHTPEQSYTVTDRFEQLAAERPDDVFLIWENSEISYDAANRAMNRYAHFARSQGLAPGDAVSVMLENRPEFLYLWFGLAKIGCIPALINTHISGAALLHAVGASTKSKALFVGEECLGQLQSIGGAAGAAVRLPTFVVDNAGAIDAGESIVSDENPSRTLREGVIGESTFCFVFTSGTTGLPKAALITHMRWLGVGDGWSALFNHTSADVFYCVLPLYHVAAGMSLLSQVLACGGSMLLRRRFSASRFWDDVRRHRVTVTQYSGEMCRYLVNQPARPNDREHGLKMMSGAGLNAEVWRRFQERFAVPHLIEGYGGTEINCGLMNLDGKIGSCGRIPFKERSNARLVRYDLETGEYIRNADGSLIECEPGEVGELIAMIVKLPGVGAGRFDGYTDPEATERKILRDVFRPGDAWFRTGDLFRRDEDDYFYFVDRTGDTFRWKSENVSTTEVAEALGAYPDLESITVYGVEAPGEEGRAGMAAIAMKPGRSFDPKAFFELASAALPSYAVPLFVRILREPDITSTFKLRKTDLQKLGCEPGPNGDPVYTLDAANRTYVIRS
ncbi:MAG TPA: long-chain-acyl-CoA synthetase [Steroidobacter sp.]|jgi:fatty-acyl-CoA synthase|nr:long-chain-acyl-CoA synthetase [Steroidobacteraceae bacterium]HLS82455.1 long-chain-acyl-CoA synthetase [Steroidobacter sp.]